MMPTAAAAAAQNASRMSYQDLVTYLSAVFVFLGMASFIEPSPYDFISFVAIPAWLFGGVRISRHALPFLLAWTAYETLNFIALTRWWADGHAQLYQLQSLYLFVTLIFFTLFFAERTRERMSVCMTAYAWSAAFSAFIAIVSYFELFGIPSLTTVEGRVSGTFKDPNAFGSYIPFGAALFLHALLLGHGRTVTQLCGLGLVLTGVLLSFSRGSWGATLFSLVLMSIATLLSQSQNEIRQRVLFRLLLAVGVAVIVIAIALSQETIRDIFLNRASVTQDYDEGVTGRFGNQLRSIPLLLDRPFGFGPLQFRKFFQIDPHNSYIGAFANGGWLAGLLWIVIIASTVFVGARLMITLSPYRAMAQVVFPSLLALLLQGFQIDIDHWRQLYLMLGMVWGLEIARRRVQSAPS